MPLPDISLMKATPPAEWRALGERLTSIGLAGKALAPAFRVAPGVGEPPRNLLITWHLRQRKDVLGWGARMFFYRDPVTEEEARAVLGDALLARLLDVGLLVRGPSGIAASLFVMPAGPLFCAFDDLSAGEDAAMGFGMTTIELCRAAAPAARVGAALDLGCGAGVCALTLARHAERVLGTDINARAVDLAKINAAINGITNVDFRVGDLFAPAEGARFDLIVSQPPFVARPEGVESRTYLYGGTRGDELALRVLAGARAHLTPAGRALVLIEFPEIAASPLEGRIREAMSDPGARVLMLQTEHDVDDDAISYALAEHRGVGDVYARAVTNRREHFERLGVTSLHLSFTIVEHAARTPGWIGALPIEFGDPDVGLTAARIDAALAAFDLADAGRDAVLAARLRVPEGTRFVEEIGGEGAITARFGPWLLHPALTLNRDSYEIVAKIAGAATVRDGIAELAKRDAMTMDEAIENILPAVEALLRAGLFEVA